MTWAEFEAALSPVGIPAAYAAFPLPQSLPYLIYGALEEPDLIADNTHYFPATRGYLELYARGKSHDLERRIKSILADQSIPYSFDNEAWIDSEKMHMTRWTFTVLGGL